MPDTLIYGGSMVAIVIAINEIIKRLGVETKWLPLTGMLMGIVLAIVSAGFKLEPAIIIGGITVGLSASGLWDFGAKTVLNK